MSTKEVVVEVVALVEDADVEGSTASAVLAAITLGNDAAMRDFGVDIRSVSVKTVKETVLADDVV